MRTILAICVVGLVLACGQTSRAPAPRPSPISPKASLKTGAIIHGVPERLRIPKLGVDAAIEQVSTDRSGRMGVPTDYHNVAWYAPGVIPGDEGDAVIAGHLDWVDGGHLVPAVFARLASLGPDDEIDIVTGFHDTLRFSVTESTAIPHDADPARFGIFAPGGPPRLTLITCTGTFSQQIHQYDERRIVTASPIGSPAGQG